MLRFLQTPNTNLEEINPNSELRGQIGPTWYPILKILRKETTFEWIDECDQPLIHIKKELSKPTVLTWSSNGEILYLYLVVAFETVRATFNQETPEG